MNYDFLDCDTCIIETTDLSGWVSLVIEYKILSMINILIWRIQGTEKQFQIDLSIVYKHHGPNIKEHFIATLEAFREDYITWTVNGDGRADKYHEDFQDLILM